MVQTREWQSVSETQWIKTADHSKQVFQKKGVMIIDGKAEYFAVAACLYSDASEQDRKVEETRCAEKLDEFLKCSCRLGHACGRHR